MVENLYEWSIGTKSPYKLKPYGQILAIPLKPSILQTIMHKHHIKNIRSAI